MELNKTYNVNIICIDKSLSYLIIIEQFNSDATQYFQDYYKQLLCYNKCSGWFEKLECAHIEVGNVSSQGNLNQTIGFTFIDEIINYF